MDNACRMELFLCITVLILVFPVSHFSMFKLYPKSIEYNLKTGLNQILELILTGLVCLKVFVHVERSSEVASKRRPLVHNLFVKIIPEHLKKLVMQHNLFQREIVFYR